MLHIIRQGFNSGVSVNRFLSQVMVGLSIIVHCLLVYSVTDAYTGPIVHLFEWKFDDIATDCENFLSSHGFSGVQVSPVAECLILENRPWYERYQTISYKICSRSGDETSFRNMVKRCSKVGIKIYVDVVINHTTGDIENATGICGSTARTKEFYYPAVPYNKEDFNSPTCGIQNFDDPIQVKNCELVGLHDLNTTRNNVRESIIHFLNHLIVLGVAGFRVDAAFHIWPQDLQYIYSKLNSSQIKLNFPDQETPLIYQEVIDNGPGSKKAKTYTPLGLVTDFKYGKELSRAFKGNNPLKWLHNFGTAWDLLSSNESLVFIDNHDTQRGSEQVILTYKESRPYKMAVAFMLSWPHGLPRIMSSFSFTNDREGPPHDENYNIKSVLINDNICSNGWICEHRWRQIYNMVKFRKIVEDTAVTSWWDNDNNQIAFCRGNKGFVAFNIDSTNLNTQLQTCLPEGKYCDIISGDKVNGKCTGKKVEVDKDGYAFINIKTSDYDGVLAIHQESKI